MRRFPLPDKSTPLLEADGVTMSQTWFEYFAYLDRRGVSDAPDVNVTSLANGQALIWNATSGKWENGAN